MRSWFTVDSKPVTSASNSVNLEELIRGTNEANSGAGVSVTPKLAMSVPAIASAVGLISETVAQLPLPIYEALEKGKERRRDHPLWPLLNYAPNDFQDAFQWRETMQMHCLMYGNCYSFRNEAAGKILELLPIHPDTIKPEQDEKYRVTYVVTLLDGSQLRLTRDSIFHIADRSFNGFSGSSRIMDSKESVGTTIQLDRYAGKALGNGAQYSGILETDKPLTKEQVTMLMDTYREALTKDKAFNILVADKGLKFNPTSSNAQQAQFIENRKFQISEASRIFRVPPHMLGDLERATFSNIEHQSIEFVTFAAMPWLKRWEMAINTQLINKARRGKFYAEFNVDGLLRGDIKSRYEAYQIGLQNKFLNPNEVREMENKNPYEGGDEFSGAANLYGDATEETPDEEPSELEAAATQLIRSRISANAAGGSTGEDTV